MGLKNSVVLAIVKVLCLILSVYFISLTGVACADHQDSWNKATIVHNNDMNHAHEMPGNGDGCSPFCFCQCCHVQVSLEFPVVLDPPEKLILHYSVYHENFTGIEIFDILRPPISDFQSAES